jgi:mycoredoxin
MANSGDPMNTIRSNMAVILTYKDSSLKPAQSKDDFILQNIDDNLSAFPKMRLELSRKEYRQIPMAETIIIYGTSWCWSSRKAREIFEKNDISFQWIDIDEDDEGGRIVMSINHGNRSVPTIVFPDGSNLVEPSDSELKSKLNIQ